MPQAMWFGLKIPLLYKYIIYIAIALFSITKGRQTFINRVEQVQRYQLSRQISCVKCKPATHPLLTDRKRPHLSISWIQCTADHYICIMHACALIVLVVRPLVLYWEVYVILAFAISHCLKLLCVCVCVCVCVCDENVKSATAKSSCHCVNLQGIESSVWGQTHTVTVFAISWTAFVTMLVFCSFATSARVRRSGRIQFSHTTESIALRHIYDLLWPGYLGHQEPVFFCLH